MSLFIDSDHINASDLGAHDPEVPILAARSSVALEGDLGMIRRAWVECAAKLSNSFQNFSGNLTYSGTIPSTIAGNRPKLRLDHVVVSSTYGGSESLVHQWLTRRALMAFYRALMLKSASNDRLQAKYEIAEADEMRLWRDLRTFGLPVVLQPLPAPAASHVIGSGSWSAAAASGGSASAGSWMVVITWTDSRNYVSASNQGNAESGPSEVQVVTLVANQQITVDISGLVPPGSVTQQVGFADGTSLLRAATHWNVYAAPLGSSVYRLQNTSPLPIATTSHSFTPASSGALMGPGQYPDANYTIANTVLRG